MDHPSRRECGAGHDESCPNACGPQSRKGLYATGLGDNRADHDRGDHPARPETTNTHEGERGHAGTMDETAVGLDRIVRGECEECRPQ